MDDNDEMSERFGRPESDDYDLLTFGEAGARLAQEIEEDRRRLQELEEKRSGVGDDREVASEIGVLERRVEALQAAQQRNSPARGEHLAVEIRMDAEIEEGKRRLEQLEERMFYVGEDSDVASEIAVVEQRLEALKAARGETSRPRRERIAAEIEEGKRRLERLEERMCYVGEDSDVASEIATVERHIEALQQEQQ